MVADSTDTWKQAAEGPVVDWQSPAYTYLQRAVYLVMRSPSGVAVLQCLAMAWVIQRLLRLGIRMGLRVWLVAGFGAFVALLPPVGAFTATLVKDVPYTVGFLLLISYVAEEALIATSVLDRGVARIPPEVWLGLGIVLMGLSRQNGFIAILGALPAVIVVSRHRIAAVGSSVAGLGSVLVVSALLYPAIGVRGPPEQYGSFIYWFDLGAMYQRVSDSLSPDVIDDLALFGTEAEWRDGFNCHWAGPTFQTRFYEYKPLDVNELQDEWKSSILKDPLFLTGNHLCAASAAWNPFASPEELDYYQTVWDVVVDNPQGVVSDPLSDRLGAAARNGLRFVGLTNHDSEAWNPGVTQFLLWRAPTWMYALGVLLVVAAVRFKRWMLLWLVLPFVAQAASVIAIAGPHYRYMAPAWISAVLLLPVAATLALGGRAELIASEDAGADGKKNAETGRVGDDPGSSAAQGAQSD